MRKRTVTIVVLALALPGAVVFTYLRLTAKNDAWQMYLPGICSFSSPRAADLNEDGILDIVIGAGGDEFQGCDSAVMAFDGKNGEMLWHVPGRDQMVGSVIFFRIDEDHVQDVIISGRAGQLMAINGKKGKVIWEFHTSDDFERSPDSVFLNFYGPQLIPDQDQDGKQDLLVAYGGDATIPWHEADRPAGKLMLVSSRTGRLLAQAEMPDGAETYMTPLCADLKGDGKLTIIFGSGGETLDGRLYRIPFNRLLTNDLSSATLMASGNSRGFIAPPVLADITHDGTLDIIANAVDGRIMAFDGEDNSIIWENRLPEAEVYGSLAVGHFNQDNTPDFFTNFGVGIFPEVEKSIQLMVDGNTGEIEFMDSLGFLQIGSPLAVDMDGDGWDEALMSVNWYDTRLNRNHYNSLYGIRNQLLVFHFARKASHILLGDFVGANPAATPFIGNLDGDDKMDIIYTYMTDTIHYQPFNGMKIMRKELNVNAANVKWGSYMGSAYNGIFGLKEDLSND